MRQAAMRQRELFEALTAHESEVVMTGDVRGGRLEMVFEATLLP